jgi:GTPase
MRSVVVAIDGPSGSGKSSTARAVALRAGWKYLDTGALYRAITWLFLKEFSSSAENISQQQVDELIQILTSKKPINFTTDPESPKVFCGSEDLTSEIRSMKVTENVSYLSRESKIREYLLGVQRQIINSAEKGIVVEGRDIGTVVAPDANLKVFLYADLAIRTSRREAEILGTPTSVVEKSLSERDEIDSTRKVSPLLPASDALELDSTEMNLQEVVDVIWEWLGRRKLIGLPLVAIIGRPNVGKSTLVNRMIGRREAIVEDTPGVTRDRVKYEAEWNGKRFYLLDTGGWELHPEGIAEKISSGVEAAIREADLIVFVVDAQVGAVDEDSALVTMLRKSSKPVLLVANKVDNPNDEAFAHSLWNIGLGEPHFISALHGRGSGDFLDLLISTLPEVGREISDDGFRRVAIVGRPNVGKSSLLNSVAGENRVIVDDFEGTTRDPVDELVQFGGSTWRFIDTAGLRKRAHQDSGTDYYASLRTALALDRAEVALVLFDATMPVTEQDTRIVTMVEEAGRAMVLVMNKWDLVDEERQDELLRELDRQLERYRWVARVNVSAKTGWHRDRLAPALSTALRNWEKRVPTSKLNSFLGGVISGNPPPVRGGKQPKIKFATQASISPPKFVIFANDFIEVSYRKFLERRLREEFDFSGTPIEVVVKIKERT